MSDQAVASFYMEGDSLELLWHNTDSLPEQGDLFLTSGTSQQLEAQLAALKEENERLGRVCASLQDVIHADNEWKRKALIEIDSLAESAAQFKARVAELEDGVARCRHQASYCIGEEEALKNQLMRVRDIANELLSKRRGANQ